jgi:hypothetical protein
MFDAPGDANGTFPQSITSTGVIAGHFVDGSDSGMAFSASPMGR